VLVTVQFVAACAVCHVHVASDLSSKVLFDSLSTFPLISLACIHMCVCVCVCVCLSASASATATATVSVCGLCVCARARRVLSH